MNNYTELDTALAAIESLNISHDKEFSDTMELMDILSRNNTVGITMDDGKRLKKLGVDINLDDLGDHRTHVGNESALLTEGGKTGLYGLAIGALVVLLGFIIKKIYSWFKKGSGGGDSTSTGKTNKELAKEVPSMNSNPSKLVKIPALLADDSSVSEFENVVSNFLIASNAEIERIAFADWDSIDEASVNRVREESLAILKKEVGHVGYSSKATTLDGLATEIKDTPLADLKYGELDEIEVFINAKKLSFSDNVIKAFKTTEDDMTELSKEDATNNPAIRIVKDVATIVSSVLTRNFIKLIGIIKMHNDFVATTDALYIKIFTTSTLSTLKKNDETKPFFAKIDFATQHEDMAKAFDKMLSSGKGKGVAAVELYRKDKENIGKYEERMNKLVSPKEDK